jgi:hypothetical protein
MLETFIGSAGSAKQEPPMGVLTKLETIPQRLKPLSYPWTYGTDKSVPFQRCGFFINLSPPWAAHFTLEKALSGRRRAGFLQRGVCLGAFVGEVVAIPQVFVELAGQLGSARTKGGPAAFEKEDCDQASLRCLRV